jgi:DNA repair protein RecO (recombination protein O)
MRHRRVDFASAFLLHQRPYSDSSRILELFTRDSGRVTLFARGVRGGGRSGWRAALQPFNALLVSWSGSGDGGRLTGAELALPPRTLPPERLLLGFYVNELLLKLLAREDAHPALYDGYVDALAGLVAAPVAEAVLRRFERRLLDELGYGIDFGADVDGAPLAPGGYYRFRPGVGFSAAPPGASGAPFEGALLAAIDDERYEDAAVEAGARRLFRDAIAVMLDGRELASRAVYVEMKHREPST